MAVERSRRVTRNEDLLPPTSPLVISQRRRYNQLWEDLENPQLTSEQKADKNSELMWLEVSLGYFTPIEGQARLLVYYDDLEKNDPDGDDYLNSSVLNSNGAETPRTIEIRNRVLTKDQFDKISRNTSTDLIREVMKVLAQNQ